MRAANGHSAYRQNSGRLLRQRSPDPRLHAPARLHRGWNERSGPAHMPGTPPAPHLGATDLSVAPGEQHTVEVPLSDSGWQLLEHSQGTEAFVGVFQKGKYPGGKCDLEASSLCHTSAANFRKVTVRSSTTTAGGIAQSTASTSRRPPPATIGRQRERPSATQQGPRPAPAQPPLTAREPESPSGP